MRNVCPVLNENKIIYIIHILDYYSVPVSKFKLWYLAGKFCASESVSIDSVDCRWVLNKLMGIICAKIFQGAEMLILSYDLIQTICSVSELT